ncbi:MAG TPA: hypothetical protein VJP85_02065 [Candidatus Baltobacteraceae bacterium]|nr:hypothetical protein [Candidatus Baltobacteraceae bacterium]
MAQVCRAAFGLVLAVVVARSSVTVSWNTRPAVPAPVAAPVRTATVLDVRGTDVLLRMSDGTIRMLRASTEQARELQHLVGTIIRFQVR